MLKKIGLIMRLDMAGFNTVLTLPNPDSGLLYYVALDHYET